MSYSNNVTEMSSQSLSDSYFESLEAPEDDLPLLSKEDIKYLEYISKDESYLSNDDCCITALGSDYRDDDYKINDSSDTDDDQDF